ncbi:cholesterol 7-desaturase [Zootermopsis nevadensis]|uniref:cholesterol 7-desaturase n=1 Tax=Zootermopsis nevadensis TaxID=136037 RepID=A0A067RH14_ZOONE|nr:cholesterol 7-desaturase [Zootermopsis nevadensis]KDR22323.1 3-chlorobenzoate-3,4-dioxygenase oxygenase subunit [Zootermopsis nevadensis]
MDSSNANISLYSALWLGQTLDLDLLSPCVLNFANRLVTVQFYTWLQTLFVTVLLVLTYYYVVLPMDYVKDLSDVGYGHLLEGSARRMALRKGRRKCDLVREMRRLRKVGSLPPVYPNGWFCLLNSSELAPGEVKHVSALGENFAVFRTREGIVHILDAYCPHLGANMAVGGTVRGDCLECPFHLWRFRGEDGKCSSIPYSEKVPDFVRAKTWPSCEKSNIIFVWYHAEGEEPTWHVSSIPEIQNGQFWYRGRNEFVVNSHIQDIPENAGDLAHLNALHTASMLAGSDLRYVERLFYRFARHVWSGSWQPSADAQHQATMKLHHEFRLFDKFPLIVMDVHVKQIGPAYVELYLTTSLGVVIILQTVTPVEPLLQKLEHRIYCPPSLSLFAKFILYGESVMVERDIMIWNHKSYVDKPILVKEDQSIRRHRHWYSQFYSENSPRFSFQQENTDW